MAKSCSVTGTKIVLQDTSIMPDIPGLPALITMLFSPVMELRSERNYYSLGRTREITAMSPWF